MVKLADKVDKTVVINILHLFKNIKENVNMIRIEVIVFILKKKEERSQTN